MGKRPSRSSRRAASTSPRSPESGDKTVDPLDLPPGKSESAEPVGADRLATVVTIGKATCTAVDDADVALACILPAAIAAVQRTALAAGDRVRIVERSGSFVVAEVLPRRTELSRPDPHQVGKLKTMAANIDAVVHVVTLRQPPLRLGLIDRFLVAVLQGGAEPIVCVNKIDLVPSSEVQGELAKLDPIEAVGVRVFTTSCVTAAGIDELIEGIRGKMTVFVGHSGVGKSSLLVSILGRVPEAVAIDAGAIAMGAVHKSRGTGTHTTRKATLYDLGSGTRIIDTPGIRELGLWDLDEPSLRAYFPEFEEISLSCKFNDCTHSHEVICGVKVAVESGVISRARFDGYLRLLDEVRNGDDRR